MTIDKSALKALAEAAPAGPWIAENDSIYFKDDGYTRHLLDADAGYDVEDYDYYAALSFIAAASPATILAMLAEIDRMEREQKNDLIAYKAAIERQKELRAERDQLSKELESHKRMLLAAACDLGAVGEALGADMGDDGSELEGLAQELRKDAGRYRWLKGGRRSAVELDAAFDPYGVPVDESIDEAIAKEAGGD